MNATARDAVSIGSVNVGEPALRGAVYVLVQREGKVRISLSNGLQKIPALTPEQSGEFAELVAKATAVAAPIAEAYREFEAKSDSALSELQNSLAKITDKRVW